MEEKAKIHSENLEITLRLPQEQPQSQRFDRAAVAEQVILNGRHAFCVPEQLLPERVTCYGTGLCGEFVWNGLAEQAAPGEQFPKLGVGLLTQRPEGGPHSVWKQYEIDPFDTEYRLFHDRAQFVQQPKPCMGIAARVYKELHCCRNTLTLYTTIENTGDRPLELYEYQHNFLCIDRLPVGPGYRLVLPFDGELAAISEAAKTLEGADLPNTLHAEGDSVRWDRFMDSSCFYKETNRLLLPMARHYWRLSHDASPASVTETVSFAPARLVVWGIEHCVCAEVYAAISVPPGKRQSYCRTWTFED